MFYHISESKKFNSSSSSSKYIDISFPRTYKYSTTAQTAKAIATEKHLTAQRRTRKSFTLQHNLQITVSCTFVMQIHLTRVTSRN